MSLAEQLKKERELKLLAEEEEKKQKKQKEEEETERKDTETVKVIIDNVVAEAKANVIRGFVDINNLRFGRHYYEPCGPRCRMGSVMCFSVCAPFNFDPQRLKGLARKLYFALVAEPHCFTVKVIDDFDCVYFQARWD